ncbi:hypothetical protein PG993_011562 [Apiospora rasikravindrae]|uniref:Uncharacterized protein n=1 Tax=Apiospora rasikravindrae TaxID=990691 RepID=A0ABR1S1K6_9PEZI
MTAVQQMRGAASLTLILLPPTQGSLPFRPTGGSKTPTEEAARHIQRQHHSFASLFRDVRPLLKTVVKLKGNGEPKLLAMSSIAVQIADVDDATTKTMMGPYDATKVDETRTGSFFRYDGVEMTF